MKPPSNRVRKLRLEWLESRTLLAGVGFEEAVAQVSPAVTGSGGFTIGFNPRIGSSELFVTGSNAGSMTIDFDRLPSFVTAVTVKDFERVTFTGTDVLNKLVASNIQTLAAGNITVTFGLYANNVQAVSLATGGGIAVLNGVSTKLEIANLDHTLIISDLQSLSIASQSPNIAIVSLNSTQTVSMLYPAQQVSVAGLTDSAAQVTFPRQGGDPAGTTGAAGNVVTVIPSEQTNILVARIREVLRAGDQGNPLAVLESVAQEKFGQAPAIAAARAEPYATRFSISPPDIPLVSPDLGGPADSVPTLGQFELRAAGEIPAMPELSDVVLPDELAQPGAALFAGFGEAALGEIMPDDADPANENMLVTREAQALFMENLQAEGRTLRDVVLNGMAAEILPGEQSAFLLVDPKPARPGVERNREASLQEIV